MGVGKYVNRVVSDTLFVVVLVMALESAIE